MTQGKYQHKPELPFGLGMEGSGIVKKPVMGLVNSKLAMKLPLEHWEKAFSDFIVVDERAAELKP